MHRGRFMKILIFGGTTEGRMLAQAISELHKDSVKRQRDCERRDERRRA